ncbi:hypothetical protein [Paracoccus versutus]|uniref:Uncharacterized protein n=1 Tax=Paracoccus versutus TaxID=34007 RepID=A0A3D9Y2U7_PARVE|nr:hypothetical protein [Paracoccus versutus]REF73519.1 hypothetical protein BDD41_2084 [Paracoccus versutus]WGR54787.1 hypothetical protein E3U25_01525 [Paracoccus versutus]
MLHQSEFDSKFAVIQGHLRLIAWRNSQTEQITDQFAAAWPELEMAIDRHVAELSLFAVARAHSNVPAATGRLLAPWVEAQTKIAAVRAQDDLAEVIALLPQDGIASHAWTVLPAVGGLGLIAASVLAMPTVLSFATVTVFGFLATTSSPLLLAGGAVLAVMSLTGSAAIGKAKQRGRTHLAERIKRQARSAIFGDGRNPWDRCVVSDTQAAVLKAAQTALEA